MNVCRPAVVVFDLGNVLVRIRPEAFLQTLGIDTPENRRAYQHKVIDVVKRYERGEDSTETFLQNLGTLFNVRDTLNTRSEESRRYSREDFRRAMLSIVERPIPGMEELVRALGTKVPLGLLSNTNPLHFDACMENLAVLRSIPFHFLSYRLRMLKPEPAIFEKTIELLQRDPRDVLYIDDLSENVEAARRAGFHGYHFVGVDTLKECLSGQGLV